MTRDQIITQLFMGKNFNQCIGKMEPEHLRDDLKMEVMAVVCELPEEKLKGLHDRKELEFYVVRIILNMIQSNTSPFFYKYRKFQLSFIEESHEIGEKGNEAQRRHFMNLITHIHDRMSVDETDMQERQKREDTEDRALAEIEGLHWYNAGLLKLYGQLGNYRAIAKATRIPHVSIYHTIKKSIKELKQKAICSVSK